MKVLLLCFLPCFWVTAHGQALRDTARIAALLQAEAERGLRKGDGSALSVGVVVDGHFVTRHAGALTPGGVDRPTDATCFEIASVTKPMVGYLVAKAVEEGRLRLDDYIRAYLPAAFPNLEYAGEPVRIRHLLTHTSGLPGFLPLAYNGIYETLLPDVPARFRQSQETYGRVDFWDDLAAVELTRKPGTEYAYGSAGAELLAYILEETAGVPLERQLQRELFGPAGMRAAGCGEDTAKVVRGYWMDNDAPAPLYHGVLWGGGAGVTATLPDLLRFGAWQLTDKAAVRRSHEELYTARTRRIAYFWNVRGDAYGHSYHHHGGTSGTQNWLYVFADHDVVIAVVTNHSGPRTPGRLSAVAGRIARSLIDTRR